MRQVILLFWVNVHVGLEGGQWWVGIYWGLVYKSFISLYVGGVAVVGMVIHLEMFTSGGGLDDDPSDEPAVMPSISHSDVVSESLSLVLGGDK